MTQVVILAGGKGTRLRERLGNLPKPLIDICGVPLLERQILLAKKYQFTHVVVLVNHAAEHIVEFCKSKDNWGLDIKCIDDGEPLGTAGATLAVFDFLADEFLVMYGDTMMEVDLARFHDYHSEVSVAAATLFLHPNDHPQDSDLVDMREDGQIVGFFPYPHDGARYYPNLVNAALYWVRKNALESWRSEGCALDFGKDLFPAMIRKGLLLRGYCSPEYIKDVGTPSRLDKVCADFASGKIEHASLAHQQAMVFIDRDGTINQEVNHLSTTDQMTLLPGVSDAIRRLNRSDFRCCVVTNQPVIARGECSLDELRQIHNKMETLLGRGGAFVDRIYFCPHHPQKGFPGERAEFKVDCNCRKPRTGMLDQAILDFNVDKQRSWFIGDSTVDIETARRAGVRSILVETGYAGLDYREWATPDFVLPNLEAAVTFVLDEYPRMITQCTKIADTISEGELVLVGGQSRSGKSTFASILRDALRSSGKNAKLLALDRWLKNNDERGPSVLGRYDGEAINEVANSVADPQQRPDRISLPGYHKLKKARIDAVESISLTGSDIIIIEGTIALSLAIPICCGVHRFHVEIDERSRKQRVLDEYQLRGMTESGALDVYLCRLTDEYPVIERFVRQARRINLNSENFEA